MSTLILILILISFLISAPICWMMIRVSIKLGAIDSKPVVGQLKDSHRPIPNTGGIGIACGILIPLLVGFTVLSTINSDSLPSFLEPMREHLPGLRSQLALGWTLIGSLFVIHVLGLIDDRKPMGPWSKLVIMLVPGMIFAIFFDTRLMTLLDGYVGGTWLSIVLTVLWFGLIINAMNFIDNMDGLSGGVALIASALFLVAALINGQWFIAATLALLVGSCLGFLIFNLPPAKMFMGDGGSLVLGLLLAFLTVRTTYVPADTPEISSGAWYALLMPIVILAIPLYDFFSVTLIRIYQRKSPFVGDLQHFSHRIRARGLGPRSTISVIYALTLATGISGLVIARVSPMLAALLGLQVVTLLIAIAIFEYRSPTEKDQ